jgi:hypothetical protein
MPNYRTHLVGGTVSFLILIKLASYLPAHNYPSLLHMTLGLPAALLGSIFPDIDISSKMQRIFYMSILIAIIIALLWHNWPLFLGASFFACAVILIKHRTFTHRPWFIVLFPLVLPIIIFSHHPKHIQLALFIYSSFVFGAFSHILLDFGIKRLFKRGL